MSPTSYQTAPPRGEASSVPIGAGATKVAWSGAGTAAVVAEWVVALAHGLAESDVD
jgi:hypothetical protein